MILCDSCGEDHCNNLNRQHTKISGIHICCICMIELGNTNIQDAEYCAPCTKRMVKKGAEN